MSGAWQLGIDVGGTSVRLVGRRADGERGAVVAAPAPPTYDAFLELVAELRERAVDGAVAAAGCGLPGSSTNGTARFVPALPWLENRPVADDLARALGAPVRVGLDGHLALLGEAAEGGARGHSFAVLVAVGTGIGGAVMIGGRIWRGAHGCAGSWGWLPADGGTDDPQHGPFEQVASGRALDALARPRSARELVEAARGGEEAACATVARFGDSLGRGLAAIASVVDPEVVLVAGGLSSAIDVLGPALEEAIRRHGSPAGRTVPVRAAELGPEAGVVGAAVFAARGEEVWL